MSQATVTIAAAARTARMSGSLALTGMLAAFIVAMGAAPAQAHPLGNFTINHYDGLALHPDRVDDTAVVDSAEIPTMQTYDAIDTNHDGALEPAERSAYASAHCARLSAAVTLRADGKPVSWQVSHAGFAVTPGAAGLPTSRLTCSLTAAVRIDTPTTLDFADALDGDHIGWREITATYDLVHADGAPIPQRSVSDQLRHYPNDLLASPLDIRAVTLKVAPGSGAAGAVTSLVPTAGLAARLLGHLTTYFDRLVGARRLTFGIGVLALLLSLVLGASHAALPGHGKTVMAAYLAGKRGGARDAITVGATVTLTHTAGVLLLGLLLTMSASLAGESILNWLSAASGGLIAVIGLGLVRSAWRTGRGSQPDPGHGHGHGHHSHHRVAGHTHEHAPGEHLTEPHGHDHGHPHTHGHRGPGTSRRGLIGMGIAGGLVPSPSALVVLLGAVALGRTVFGVALVLGYGFGMAMTLTAAGLLIVRLRDRTQPALLKRVVGARVLAYTPLATAILVLTVGAALAIRSLTPMV